MADTLRQGRFVVMGVLGEGSQGCTFDGVDKQLGQPVAIKRFDVRGAHAWKDVELAERETRVLRQLSHPSLPRYVDHFEEDGVLYLVTEKMEGASLASLRRQGVPFGESDALRLLEDAANVLTYLHGRSPPVVHRDIKPANVIRRPDGSFAFVDFGAVRDNLRPEGGSTVVGTFGYMAPEQFQGRALPGSDVYGVGATVVSLLAGVEPEALPHRGLAIDVRAALRGKASERVIRVLDRMLDPDPDQRASAIAPLLTEGPSEPWARSHAAWDDSLRHEVRREARRVRRAAHEEANALRRAARQEANAWRRNHRHHHELGWPLEVLFTLVFSVGLVVVSVVTRVALPVLLRVLSVFFARRSLTAAADAVQDAGGAAVRAMSQSRRWMRAGAPMGADTPAGEPQTRIAPDIGPGAAPAGGIRVVPADAEDTGDEDDERATRNKR
jgi:hypothetical protein